MKVIITLLLGPALARYCGDKIWHTYFYAQDINTAAKQVASTGDPSPFTGDPKLQAAGKHLDTFCGVSSPTPRRSGRARPAT